VAEFTGERVVPGEVDADLWNEHFARYAFAARLSRKKRVLDAGCGTGYGTAELARVAAAATGVDISADAVQYARQHYALSNVRFLQASCAALPFAAGSFDLITAFEVIEHLKDWQASLREMQRLLAPGGQCVISTPNKNYYADSRGSTGPNPYHEKEFTFEEFTEELRAVFPHVSLFLQNHVEGFVFQPVKASSGAEARLESGTADSPKAHFYVAVCALAPQTGAPTFLHVPSAANILREREVHIDRLATEISLKNRSIADLASERDQMIEVSRRQKDELETSNRWAAEQGKRVEEAGAEIGKLQKELEELARGYEAKIAELEEDNRKKAEWAIETESRLTRELADKCHELAVCVDALHQTEKTLEERTNWALSLDAQVRALEAQVNLVKASRWIKLGNKLGMGPRFGDS
jgi:SAM-dependent methyltransferase